MFNILNNQFSLLYLPNNKFTAMKPDKEGQIVKFHTPLEGENPDQQYVVLEIQLDTERPRAQIQALNTGLAFPTVNTVSIDDLAVVEADSTELLGHTVTIKNRIIPKLRVR